MSGMGRRAFVALLAAQLRGRSRRAHSKEAVKRIGVLNAIPADWLPSKTL